MKRPAKVFAWVILLLLSGSPVCAQTFEEFKNQIREEYDTFEKETQQKFDNFVAQIDKEFSDYLVKGFTLHAVEKDKLVVTQPKPEVIPIMDEVEINGDILDFEVANVPITYQGPAYPGIMKSEDPDFETQRINVDFLGWPLYFDLDKNFYNVKPVSPTAENISILWSDFASLNYNHLLYQISEVANILNLNQWAYYQLLKKCSEKIYPTSHNLQIGFQWSMLNRSRYKSKIGYSNDNLYLLIPSIYKMYNIDFVVINGIDYYVLNGKGAEIQTYTDDFPESDIIMDVSIKKPFNTEPIKKTREYHFKHQGKKHTIKLDYDEEMINFYKTIPLSEIVVYFNSVVCERTKESVKKAFKPLLDGKDDVEFVNLLLSFMQQAFGYKTDKFVYGTERYFFADEVLHYQFSDCEDRSVLFSYLVKTLLGKEVVALGFPGHMATAVNFGHNVEGVHFIHNGSTFYVADPTFFGAPVGVLMSTVAGEKATIYETENTGNQAEKSEDLWKKINEYGGYKSDRLKDIVFDVKGNAYACGYFIGKADFDGHTIKSDFSDRDAFIAKFDKNQKLDWVMPGVGEGNDVALSLALNADGDLYVYGCFENDIKFPGQLITAVDAPDVFVACIGNDGKLNWATKAGIDKLDHSLDFMFMAKFNKSGEKIRAKLYSQSEDFGHHGLDTDNNGNAVIVGSFYATSGMNSNDFTNYDFGSELDIPVALYETDIKLKENEYEATIAGLFSALNLLKANSIEIQGSEIKSTFDTYNNKFSTYASGIYDNLANMRFVKNNKGIISIKTSDGNPIILDKIKIGNDARIRIVKYKSGNILVEVLSGIYVGGGNYWLDMNSIKLFKESGDLLFNFDTDNSVKKLNLKKELLKKS